MYSYDYESVCMYERLWHKFINNYITFLVVDIIIYIYILVCICIYSCCVYMKFILLSIILPLKCCFAAQYYNDILF